MSVSLSPRHRRLGLREEDAPFLEYFCRVARSWGWSDSRVEAAIEWGARNQHGPLDKIEQDFITWSTEQGLSAVDADLAIAWRDNVVETGLPELPPAQFTSADAERLREIEQTLRTDRSRYERENMGDEFHDLLALQQGSGVVTERIAASSDRKAELERILRTDRREYFNAGHHEEYARILRAESGEQVADNQPEPFPAQTPVNLEIPE